ncbi:MAG: hypothetical protein ACTHLT_00625 [Devosia sp.]
MQNPTTGEPTLPHTTVKSFLRDSLQALVWATPTAQFWIMVCSDSVGADVVDPNGVVHGHDIVFPVRACVAVKEAWRAAFSSGFEQLAVGAPTNVGQIDDALALAFAALPTARFRFGRSGDLVWGEIQNGREFFEARLDARHFSLADAFLQAVDKTLKGLPINAPEAREAA